MRYPDPVRGPTVPYNAQRKHNPRATGWTVVLFAFLMEQFGFIRRFIWKNAGFAALPSIREHIDEVEARFDPTVVPIEDHGSQRASKTTRTLELEPLSGAEFDSATNGRYSVAHYRSLYLSAEITPLAVAKAILPMIRRDTSPPGKHSEAWIDVKPDLVLKAAEESTLRYKEKRSLGPLDGILAAIKDEYDVEGYATTLGSAKESIDGRDESKTVDSWVIEKLKEAGVIIVGKTAMVEYGMDTSGNNPTYGSPLNPYNSGYYCGGSSSGSAYAVSTGLVPIALGSDAGGSVRIPASFCSVHALKPSHNRLSFMPNPNHASSCCVKGPIAADISSLVAVYSVASQPHPTSPFGMSALAPPTIAKGIGRPKILGIPEQWFQQAEPGIQELCRGVIKRLCTLKNYTVVPIEIPFTVEGRNAHALTMLTDAATVLPETKGVSATMRILLALGRTTPSTDYVLAQKLRGLLMNHLAWLWQQHPGMVIVTPTSACAGWPIRSTSELKYGLSDGDRTQESMEYVWLANFCGTPSISLPAGYVVPEGQSRVGEVADSETAGKIPVGLMATGEWASETALMQFGLDVEDVVSDIQCRPPTWVDVVQLAKKET